MSGVCSALGELGPQRAAEEKKKQYSQRPLHFLPLLLAPGSAACALVHGSAVVLNGQKHGTLHNHLSAVAAAVRAGAAAALIRADARGRGLTPSVPPSKGDDWPDAAAGAGSGSAAVAAPPRSPGGRC